MQEESLDNIPLTFISIPEYLKKTEEACKARENRSVDGMDLSAKAIRHLNASFQKLKEESAHQIPGHFTHYSNPIVRHGIGHDFYSPNNQEEFRQELLGSKMEVDPPLKVIRAGSLQPYPMQNEPPDWLTRPSDREIRGEDESRYPPVGYHDPRNSLPKLPMPPRLEKYDKDFEFNGGRSAWIANTTMQPERGVNKEKIILMKAAIEEYAGVLANLERAEGVVERHNKSQDDFARQKKQLEAEIERFNDGRNRFLEDKQRSEAETKLRNQNLSDQLAKSIQKEQEYIQARIEYEMQKKKVTEILKREESKAKQIKEVEEDDTCVICLENPKIVAIVPCGHICLCEGCYSGIRTCPMCRQAKTGFLKTYRV
jgi:hypothetical protein